MRATLMQLHRNIISEMGGSARMKKGLLRKNPAKKKSGSKLPHSKSVAGGAGISGMGPRGTVQVQHAGDEIADGDSQVAPEAALQAGIILRATEEVAHQLTENRAAADELHHAGSHRTSQERSAVEAAHNARGKF